MEFSEFEPFINRSIREKIDDFQQDGRLQHLIFAAQLTPDLVAKISRIADMIRQLSRES